MGRIVSKPIWVSDDGKEFKTEAAMLEHEGSLLYTDHVNEYIEHMDFSEYPERAVKAQQTRIRKILLAYLAYVNADPTDEDEDAKSIAA